MKVSAYIPCFNNEATLVEAVASVRAQTVPVAELFVLDDASTDCSADLASKTGVRVVSLQENLGRGAARARAMLEAKHEYVLGCDATIALPPDFLARALVWMQEPKTCLEMSSGAGVHACLSPAGASPAVLSAGEAPAELSLARAPAPLSRPALNVAAVFGRVVQSAPGTVIERWRGRHLFKTDSAPQLNRRASLATGGVLLRKSLVLGAGNFNAGLRAGEDAELGKRLVNLGYDVVQDPALELTSLGGNSLLQLLERYWRWNVGVETKFSLANYLSQISYSIKVMAREDLRQSDVASAVISLLCPHYLFWQANVRRTAQSKR